MVEIEYSYAYFKVIIFLGILVVVLFFLKRYLYNRLPISKSAIKILSQQIIDHKNKISLIKYKNKEYLIVTGESGFLVDSFESEDFEKELRTKVENTNDN